MTDLKKIIERFNKGDANALGEAYTQFFEICHKEISRLGGDMEEAKEIFQQFLLSILLRFNDKSKEVKIDHPITYVRVSCHRLFINNKINQRKNQTFPIENQEFLEPGIEEIEFKSKLFWESYSTCSEECKRIFYYTHCMRLKDKEIAKIMNYSDDFVRNKRRRCNKKFKENFEIQKLNEVK